MEIADNTRLLDVPRDITHNEFHQQGTPRITRLALAFVMNLIHISHNICDRLDEGQTRSKDFSRSW